MIGALGTNAATGGPILVFGLTFENLDRLRNGQPMLLRPETHPFIPEGWTITLIAGKDDRTIMAWLQQPDTVVQSYHEPEP